MIPFAVLFFRKKLAYFLVVMALAQMLVAREQWSGLLAFIRTDAIALGVLLAICSTHSW